MKKSSRLTTRFLWIESNKKGFLILCCLMCPRCFDSLIMVYNHYFFIDDYVPINKVVIVNQLDTTIISKLISKSDDDEIDMC